MGHGRNVGTERQGHRYETKIQKKRDMGKGEDKWMTERWGGRKTKVNVGERGRDWGDRDGMGAGEAEKDAVSPGAPAGSVKSPRPGSEFCPRPTVCPSCAPAWFRPRSPGAATAAPADCYYLGIGTPCC